MLDREKILKGLEWVLEDDRFSFGEGWPIDSKPQTEEEQAGYYIQRAIDLLKEQETKTGHWVFESAYCEAWSHTCSECGKRMTTAYNIYANYCWNCGAKMEGR